MAPEKVENLYIKLPYIAEAFVYGNSLKDYCVGFFVVDELKLMENIEKSPANILKSKN